MELRALRAVDDASRVAWFALFPSAVVAASWLDAPAGLLGLARTGFLWAALLASFEFLRRLPAFKLSQRSTRSDAGDSAAPLRWALLATAVSFALPVLWAHQRMAAAQEAARVGLCLLFVASVFGRSETTTTVRANLSIAGLFFLGVQAMLLVDSTVVPAWRGMLFEQLPHAFVGPWPRFRGWMPQPMACGSEALAAMALAACSPKPRVRAVGVALGTLVVAATMSFAMTTIPLGWWLSTRLPRQMKPWGALLLVLVPCALLWVKPTNVQWAGAELFDEPPPPSYFKDGQGPETMPIRTMRIGPLTVSAHPTAYALLAVRAFTCLAEHPSGIGGRNFAKVCPVLAMNTVGLWARERGPHNAYTGFVVEGGPLAVASALFTLILVVRRFRLRDDLPLASGLFCSVLLAGWGGASPFQFPTAALVGVLLRARVPPARDTGARAALEPGPR